MDQRMNALNTTEHAGGKKVSEHECFRLLWIKVILRAAYDWVLYRNSKNHITKNIAESAYRWLFDPEAIKHRITIGNKTKVILVQAPNSLENICDAIDLDVDSVRRFAKRLTRADIKKMEFLERSTKKKGPIPVEEEILLV